MLLYAVISNYFYILWDLNAMFLGIMDVFRSEKIRDCKNPVNFPVFFCAKKITKVFVII
ncbi:hypothetical protein D3C80_2224620 [compost metagenome]